MTQAMKIRSGRVPAVPTPAEDAAINAGIANGPGSYELGPAEFKKLRRGRPLGSGTKVQVTLRLDEDVLNKFKAAGAGWQTRINEALKSWNAQQQA